MLREYFKLAVGNLAHRKTRTLLTMVGIFIGIAAIISLISLGQGLEEAVTASFAGLGSDRIIVEPKGNEFGPPGQDTAAVLTEDDLRVLQRTQYVTVAAGRLMRPANARFNERENPVFIASLPDSNEEERALVWEVTDAEIVEGRMLEPNDRNKIIIGNRWLTDDSFDQPLRVGDKLRINNESVEIVGVMDRTGNPFWDQMIVMNERPMRDLLDVPTEYSILTGTAESEQVVDLAAASATRDLRRHRNVKEREEDFTVQTSAQLLESIATILNVIQAVLVGIAAISLIVGGIGIMNTMYTSVLERTKEVGIMKAIGATNNVVLTIFLIEAAILGLIGGAIGTALGIGLAKMVELVASLALGPSVLQANISITLIVGALIFSLLVGVISGIVPALQASKMEPVEALNG